MKRVVQCVVHGIVIAALGACAIAPSRAPQSPDTPSQTTARASDEPAATDDVDPGGDPAANGERVAKPADPITLLPRNGHKAALQERRSRLLQEDGQALAVEDAGYYLDVQEARIRQALSTQDVGIRREDDSLLLRVSGTAAFDTGSSTLNRRVQPILDALAEILREYRNTLVVVASHTDASGSPALNQRLSERRALATGRYLAERGVDAARIAVIGYGESRPLGTDGAPRDRWPNRRLEIRLELLTARDA